MIAILNTIITAIYCLVPDYSYTLHYATVTYNQREAYGGYQYLYHVGTTAYITCHPGKQIFYVQCQLCSDQNSTGLNAVGRTCQEMEWNGRYYGDWRPLPEVRCGTGDLGSNHISI